MKDKFVFGKFVPVITLLLKYSFKEQTKHVCSLAPDQSFHWSSVLKHFFFTVSTCLVVSLLEFSALRSPGVLSCAPWCKLT